MVTYLGRVLKHQSSDSWHAEAIKFITSIPGGVKGKKVLDFGCGPGAMSYLLWLFGTAQIDGVDNEEMLSWAKRHYSRGPEFKTAPEGRYDVLVFSHVLGHVPDCEGTLEGLISRHLAPGGVVAVLNPNCWNTLARAIPNLFSGYRGDPTLHFHFCLSWLNMVMRRNQFDLVDSYRSGERWSPLPAVVSRPLFAAFYKDRFHG